MVNERLNELFYESDLGIQAYELVNEYFITSLNNEFERFIECLTQYGDIELYDYDDFYESLNDDIFLHLQWAHKRYNCRYGVELEVKNITDPNMLLRTILYFVFLDYVNEEDTMNIS